MTQIINKVISCIRAAGGTHTVNVSKLKTIAGNDEQAMKLVQAVGELQLASRKIDILVEFAEEDNQPVTTQPRHFLDDILDQC